MLIFTKTYECGNGDAICLRSIYDLQYEPSYYAGWMNRFDIEPANCGNLLLLSKGK